MSWHSGSLPEEGFVILFLEIENLRLGRRLEKRYRLWSVSPFYTTVYC